MIRHLYKVYYSNELYHHGIHGQRWGVRNGPPYPLDSKVSKRIKKGTQEKIRISAKEYNRLRKDFSRNPNKYSHKVVGTSKLVSAHDRVWQEVINASDNEEKYGSNYLNVADILMQDPNARYDPNWTVTKNKKNKDFLDTLNNRRVNPGYGAPGTTNNCSKCTAATAMELMGYDVQAGRSSHGTLTTAQTYWFDGAKQYKEFDEENMYNRMLKGNRNSFGEISMRYPNGGGHSMLYFVDKNSRLHIKDGQSGDMYNFDDPSFSGKKNMEWFASNYGFDLSKGAYITRLDNTTPNFKHMSEDSVLRVNYGNNNMNKVKNRETGRIVDTW